MTSKLSLLPFLLLMVSPNLVGAAPIASEPKLRLTTGVASKRVLENGIQTSRDATVRAQLQYENWNLKDHGQSLKLGLDYSVPASDMESDTMQYGLYSNYTLRSDNNFDIRFKFSFVDAPEVFKGGEYDFLAPGIELSQDFKSENNTFAPGVAGALRIPLEGGGREADISFFIKNDYKAGSVAYSGSASITATDSRIEDKTVYYIKAGGSISYKLRTFNSVNIYLVPAVEGFIPLSQNDVRDDYLVTKIDLQFQFPI